MGGYRRFALNRILCPDLSLREFFDLARNLGVGGIELRNDLPGEAIIDSLTPSEVGALADTFGITILSINAQQRFDLWEARAEVEHELASLVDLATEIGCKAIVLCPNNDLGDQRSRERMFKETVASLKSLRHFFEDSGLTGLIEPLGFPECSLRSKVDAMRAIRESGGKNYKIVHDTFHQVLGPDSDEALIDNYDFRCTGLVHISGVESDIPFARLRDPERVLVFEKDRLENKKQIELLTRQGYTGPISFEPFAPEVMNLDYTQLKREVKASLEYLTTK